ncbi:hypothetical protein PLESTM_001003100 [Pleodorina starrii]|nr:hypothetical protein PLESTM_001003100 [Pleodorina starrii]
MRASPMTQHEPLMQAVLGALPADWRRLLPADPLDPELPPAPDWLLLPGGSRVSSPTGVLWAVLPNGRLVPPDSEQAGAAGDADWPAACVLPGRKPRRHWTLEDHQRYNEAAPAQHASSWPVEYQLLGLWDSVQCYPLSHGHGVLPLIHYTVSEVHHRLTARGHSWGRDQDTGPLMPAAWPEQPHCQLQQQEARWHQHWLAQQAPSRNRWFAMNPRPAPAGCGPDPPPHHCPRLLQARSASLAAAMWHRTSRTPVLPPDRRHPPGRPRR